MILAALLWGSACFVFAGAAAGAPEAEELLSRVTTRYSEENAGRACNIRLATERISGITLDAQESFSFNGAVGERTRENGFFEAPVIENGEYVPGVGGGVCQVSSTLFCAALEAGLRILESHPHSLPVSYIPPSLDAMVSSGSDLKLFNPRSAPVRIEAQTEDGVLTVGVYGVKDGLVYRTESVTLARLEAPPAREGDVLRPGREGLVSESFLCVYGEGGELISRTRIRRDRYAPVQGIRPREGDLPQKKPE